MSNQIPPLVSHSPPPIDFDDDNDDQQQEISDNDDDFGDFESSLHDFQDATLPSPTPFSISKNENYLELPDIVPDIPDIADPEIPTIDNRSERVELDSKVQNEKMVVDVIKNIPNEKLDGSPVRNESPPSLILSQANFSDNDDDENFNDFEQGYMQPNQVEAGNDETNPASNDDNISIPSLNFDVENPSKVHTPIPFYDNNDNSDKEALPQVSNNFDEEIFHIYEDNTDNDFTDFTTASNEKTNNLEDATPSNILEIGDHDFSVDDDFAHIDSVRSVDSNYATQSKTGNENLDYTSFDADFSKFDTFPEFSADKSNHNDPPLSPPLLLNNNNNDDDFDDFQGFAQCSMTQPEPSSKPPDEVEDDDDDDDDFGDFRDFKQSSVLSEPTTPVTHDLPPIKFSNDNFLNTIHKMFPKPNSLELESSCEGMHDHMRNSQRILDCLNDFDSSRALEYQYSSSDSSKSLVKALGIDARNILYGPKWNSSMPRFAANLSFNPLEPIKPSLASTNNNNNNNVTGGKPSLSVGSTATGTNIVPAVQFDWNSSGLVNPLDGVQEIMQESSGQPKNGAKGEVLDKEVPKNTTTATTNASNEVHLNKDDFNECRFPSVSSSPHSFIIPSNVRTIKLPETHIFTPNKCINPISLEVTDRDEKFVDTESATPNELDENIPKTDKTIVIKEYRDIEYSLDKTNAKMNHSNSVHSSSSNHTDEFNDEFSEFQSVPTSSQATTHNQILMPDVLPHNISSNLVDKKDIVINWPEPGEINGLATTVVEAEIKCDYDKKNIIENYAKPVFGTSPTEELDKLDDEFSDFQAATPTHTPAVPSTNLPSIPATKTSSPILLCPSILLPQQSTNESMQLDTNAMKINWPEPGIDPDELARFEAAFPKCKLNSSAKPSDANQDDDEWSDFVSSEPSHANVPPLSTTKSPSSNETKNTNDDDWSDFIYITPTSSAATTIAPSSQNNYNSILSSNITAGPKFTSWNTPQLPPPQFNSWNSTNLYYNSQQFQHHQQQQKVPTISYNNNNYSNHFNHQQQHLQQQQSQQQQQQQQQQKIPSISLLPDMSFIAPTPTSSKPATHSFINNMISNNHFTKK